MVVPVSFSMTFVEKNGSATSRNVSVARAG
jgi:hypothetical protein